MTEALAPVTVRHRLVAAVQEVVAERFGRDGAGLPAIYAAVTALAATAVSTPGAEPYRIRAGRVLVRVGTGEETVAGIGAAAGEEFLDHAWCGRVHASGRLELVDLATRLLGGPAATSGLSPAGRFPRAVWAWEDEVPRALRYVPEEKATERVREAVGGAREAAVAEAVRAVLRKVSGSQA